MYFLDYKKKIYISKLSKNLVKHDVILFWNYKKVLFKKYIEILTDLKFISFWLKRNLFYYFFFKTFKCSNKEIKNLIKTQIYVSFGNFENLNLSFLNSVVKDKNLLFLGFITNNSNICLNNSQKNNKIFFTKQMIVYLNNYLNKYQIPKSQLTKLNSLYSNINKIFVLNFLKLMFLKRKKLEQILLINTYKTNYKII